MPNLSEWNTLCERCESVYDVYGSTPIPNTLSDDPCQVFLETRVDENKNRFHLDGTPSFVKTIPTSLTGA